MDVRPQETPPQISYECVTFVYPRICFTEDWSLEGNKLIEDNEPFINEEEAAAAPAKNDTKVHSMLKIDMILLNM